MKAQVWDDNVTIAFSDIRRWNAPEKVKRLSYQFVFLRN